MRNHGSAWDAGKKIFHFLPWTLKNSTNYLKYQKQQKTKITKVYSCAEYATRKTTMHAMALNASTANICSNKCSKIQNPHNFVCATCLTETFLFIQIENFELEKLSFNSNFISSCLQKDSCSNIHKNYLNNILNLGELTFNKNPHYSAKDPNVNVTYPTCFKYYLNHEFHKLNKNINSGKNDKFSLLHTDICSLQGNIQKLEMFFSDFEYQFDVIALTETRHNDNNPSFVAGILPGHQKYESTSGTTKKEAVDFILKILSHIF